MSSEVQERVMYFYPKPKNKREKRKVISGVVIDNHLQIGKAECSLKDRYVKKVGRDIARNRACSSEYTFSAKVKNPERLTEQFIGLAKML